MSCPFHEKFRKKKRRVFVSQQLQSEERVSCFCLLFLAAWGCWCCRVQLLSSPPASCILLHHVSEKKNTGSNLTRLSLRLCVCLHHWHLFHSAFLSPNTLIIRQYHIFCSAVKTVLRESALVSDDWTVDSTCGTSKTPQREINWKLNSLSNNDWYS